MPDLSRNPDDYANHDGYAHAQALNAKHDVARPDFNWAIGGTAPDDTQTIIEYGVEPSVGTDAFGRTDELYGAIEDLPNYAAGARVVTRTVTVSPWRYVTPEEIEAWAAE